MFSTRKALAVVAGSTLLLGLGSTTAGYADGPDSEESPELAAEIMAEPWPTYAAGDSDPNVAVAKILLDLEGYYEWDVDAAPEEQQHFGDDLEQALYEIQEDLDIGENGELHAEVWNHFDHLQFAGGTDAWGPGDGRTYYDSPDVGWEVGAIQRMLIKWDYADDSDNTGHYADTRDAVVEFQSDTCREGADPEDPDAECLDDDGLTGTLTWRALVTGGIGPA